MITTLLFDWAGVLTIGRYTQSILEVLSKEEPISIEKIYFDFDQLIAQMMEGAISFKEFVSRTNAEFNFKITDKQMEDIFKRAITPNEEMMELIRNLHSRYTLILVSDNDATTVKNLKKYHHKLLNMFTKKYFSYELKILKSNPKFFKYVIDDLNIPPSDCIFIDDKQKNVDAAKECGINGIVFSSVNQLKKELASLSVKID